MNKPNLSLLATILKYGFLHFLLLLDVDTGVAFRFPPVDFSAADAVRSDVTFQLFTNNSETGIYLDEDSVKTANINTNLPTKLLIHGWLSNETSYWYRPTREEYFKHGEYNIVYIDWSKAGSKQYHVSAANSQPIGYFIGDFIIASNVSLKNVHVIGHSLGSHVAGFVGKRVFERTRSKISRVTGTDPAGPLFEHKEVGPDKRIASTDAEFVDIVHTDIGHYGFTAAIGVVDFYPNGGKFQPGCPPLEEDDNCSHARSNLYFIESINSDGFKARSCSTWEEYVSGKCDQNHAVSFGEHVNQDATGVFYFATNSEPPFAKG